VDLGTLVGANGFSEAHATYGDVTVGLSQAGSASHATLWQGGGILDLGTLGGSTSEANGVNGNGQVVGYSLLPDQSAAAFIYQKGPMNNPNTLLPGGSPPSNAVAITAAGQIAVNGTRQGDSTPRALLLTPSQLNRFAYLGADHPTADSYNPSPFYAYNS